MGFSILKVGPWLTFALREALYRLDAIADILDGQPPASRLMATMEGIMLSDPANWNSYYSGNAQEQWIKRHFSLSDRIRYYWPHPDASAAVDRVMMRLADREIPPPLLHQYFSEPEMPSSPVFARDIIKQSVRQVLEQYDKATGNLQIAR